MSPINVYRQHDALLRAMEMANPKRAAYFRAKRIQFLLSFLMYQAK